MQTGRRDAEGSERAKEGKGGKGREREQNKHGRSENRRLDLGYKRERKGCQMWSETDGRSDWNFSERGLCSPAWPLVRCVSSRVGTASLAWLIIMVLPPLLLLLSFPLRSAAKSSP